jgi:type IV secretory pathway VirB10-like protein
MGSLVLHVGIIAVMFFTWTHKLDIVDQAPPVVPVDLVTLADKTNITPMVTQEPKPPQVMEQPTPPPLPVILQPPKFEVAPAAKPVPVQKPAPKQETFDINNVQAMLDKRQAAAAKNAKVGSRNIKGIGDQSAMTADLRAMLQSEIYRCWSPPVGAPHPEKLIVSYELFLNRDGSVAQPPQLTADSSSAATSDPYMRAAAEAARRAIYTCAPYKLPADRYNQWHDVTFVFDPRDMVGL